jgi:hypothetical protein
VRTQCHLRQSLLQAAHAVHEALDRFVPRTGSIARFTLQAELRHPAPVHTIGGTAVKSSAPCITALVLVPMLDEWLIGMCQRNPLAIADFGFRPPSIDMASSRARAVINVHVRQASTGGAQRTSAWVLLWACDGDHFGATVHGWRQCNILLRRCSTE